MPGMPIYQDSPANLKNQIFATNGSAVINVQADNTGRLKVATDSSSPLAVDVDETVNSIAVYGNDGTANQIIKTNATGQLDIRPLTVSDTVNVNITEADDSITVYGNDGTTNHIIRTNATGQLDIRPLTTSDTVNVDISQVTDSIAVYGNDGTDNQIIKTNSSGQLDIRPLTVSDTVSVNITQADDSITVYGNDGTTNHIIRTNATGQLDIRPLTSSDTVNVDISQATDSITVYGSDGTDNHILLTDAAGVLQVNTARTFANNTLTTLATTDSYQYTTQQEIAQLTTYQFFVKNTGDTNNVTVVVELSPNGTDWVIDSDERQVNPGAATIITSSKFLRYIRLGYKSTSTGASTAISAIFQGQG